VFVDCYLLQTQRGQRWTVAMKQPTGTLGTDFILGVGTGNNCMTGGRTVAIDKPAVLFSHDAKVSFVSGGGEYLVVAATTLSLDAYTLDFRLSPTLAIRDFAVPGVEVGDWGFRVGPSL
jgi:hypothetical protein